MFLQFGDQHAELGAPVPHVVLADDPVTLVFQYPRHGVADDGAAKVADVHLLGEVGRGVIHHHGLGNLCHPGVDGEAGREIGGLPGEEGIAQMDVDESRTGDVDLVGQIVNGEIGDDALGQLPGRHFHRLGGGHGAIGLVVAQALPGIQGDVRAAVGGYAGGVHGGAKAVVEQGADRHGVSKGGLGGGL